MIKLNKVSSKVLDNYNIDKFNNISEIFNFIYDEDWTKEQLVEALTDDIKKQLILQNENVREDNGTYYYGQDILELEDDLENGEINEYTADLDNEDIKKSVETFLSNTMGIPVTIGDENKEQIYKEMGELGVEIYDRYYDWYKENGMYEIFDYIDAFCYGKINDIQKIIDEVIENTENNREINQNERIKIVKQAELYKEFLNENLKQEQENEEL